MAVEIKQIRGGTVAWIDTPALPFFTVHEILLQPPSGTVGYQSIFVRRPRIPGLHAGDYWMSDDFDAPLPEDFLISESPHEATS